MIPNAAAIQDPSATAPPNSTLPTSGDFSFSAHARGADGRVLAAPGTRPELTSTDQFYRVSINSSPPKADPNPWRLSLDGLVDRPLLLGLDDIRALPAVRQVATFSCISNPVGGDRISRARWTGLRLKDLLDQAGVKPGGKFINIEAFDEYFESASLGEVRTVTPS